jgi:hypothetical protein
METGVGDTWPPIHSSLAASCTPRRILLRDERRCLTLDFVNVYPTGLHIRISARFRGLRALDEQRSIAESWRWRSNDPDRPRLTYESAETERGVRIMADGSESGFCHADLWCPGPVQDGEGRIEFEWLAQEIRSTVDISAASMIQAHNEWQQLWQPAATQYHAMSNHPD